MNTPTIHRQEVWLVNLNPPGKGKEIFGQRPALVISVDEVNNSPAELVIVAPITSIPRNIPSHIKIEPPEGGLKKQSFIKCDQIRTISKKRAIKCIGKISEKTMTGVEDAIRIVLSL